MIKIQDSLNFDSTVELLIFNGLSDELMDEIYDQTDEFIKHSQNEEVLLEK